MKTFLITLVLISAVILASPASASAATSAGVKPGSFWYGFDLAFEKINLFFTFNSEGKARKALQYADERLAEAEAVAENKNADAVKTAITNYESNMAFAAEKSKDISEKDKAEALLTSIADNTSKHQEILADVLTKVPDEAKEAITKAIEVSRREQEEAMKQIAELKGEVEQLKKEVAELKQSDSESQAAEIEKLKQEIEELKKKPVASDPEKQRLPDSSQPQQQKQVTTPTPPVPDEVIEDPQIKIEKCKIEALTGIDNFLWQKTIELNEIIIKDIQKNYDNFDYYAQYFGWTPGVYSGQAVESLISWFGNKAFSGGTINRYRTYRDEQLKKFREEFYNQQYFVCLNR